MKSLWNGNIVFGLVNIPIKIYSASEERRLDLDMLDSSDHSRIRFKRINENTGEEVEWKNIVKGFLKDDKYVILEEEDFEQANMKKSKTLEIDAFIKDDEVEEVLFKKPYFIEPQKGGAKSYNLLKDALIKSKKLGVTTFVMRAKENLSLIGVYKGVLVLHVIRFMNEIRDATELNIPETKVAKKEIDMALSLIDQYTEKFDFSKYKDVYNDQLMKIIDKKSSGKKTAVRKLETKATPAKDLMAQLKASLEKKQKRS